MTSLSATWKDLLRQSLPTPTQTPALPDVPGYHLLGILGSGGMGLVYRARQISVERDVALKVLGPAAQADPDSCDRFRLEARAIGRISHPNVVGVFDYEEHNGRQYLTMELVAGPSLGVIATTELVRPIEAAEIMELVARGVDVVHRAGIVHRDLKPTNVLLGTAERAVHGACRFGDEWVVPKVADFGLAKLMAVGSDLTATGNVVGTPRYMAPEQMVSGNLIGPTADIYSLGAILFQLLTGSPPFHDTEVHALHNAVVNRPATRPSRLRSGISNDLDAIVLKCLEKAPEHRYQSAAELADDLRRFVEGKAVLAKPPAKLLNAWRTARRHPLATLLVTGLVTAILSGALASWQLYRWADRERRLAEVERISAAEAREEAERTSKIADAERRAAAAERQRADAVDSYLLTQVIVPAIQGGVHPNATLASFIDELAKLPAEDLAKAPESAASVQHSLASHYGVRGDFERAVYHSKQAVRIADRAFGPGHEKTILMRRLLVLHLSFSHATDELDAIAVQFGTICEATRSQALDPAEEWLWCSRILANHQRYGAADDCLAHAIDFVARTNPGESKRLKDLALLRSRNAAHGAVGVVGGGLVVPKGPATTGGRFAPKQKSPAPK